MGGAHFLWTTEVSTFTEYTLLFSVLLAWPAPGSATKISCTHAQSCNELISLESSLGNALVCRRRGRAARKRRQLQCRVQRQQGLQAAGPVQRQPSSAQMQPQGSHSATSEGESPKRPGVYWKTLGDPPASNLWTAALLNALYVHK